MKSVIFYLSSHIQLKPKSFLNIPGTKELPLLFQYIWRRLYVTFVTASIYFLFISCIASCVQGRKIVKHSHFLHPGHCSNTSGQMV